MLSQLQGEIRCERERLDEHRKQLQQCIVLYCIVLYCIVQVEKQDSMLSQLQGEIRCERERLDEHRKQLQQCKKVITDLQKELERNQTEKQDSNDKVLW